MEEEKNGSVAPVVPTNEELAILQFLVEGHKDDVVAARLGLARRTYRRRFESVMAKLGAKSRFQAGVIAAERGWVTARTDTTPASDLFSPRDQEGATDEDAEPAVSRDMRTELDRRRGK